MATKHSIATNGDCGPGSKVAKIMCDHSNAGPPTKFELSGEKPTSDAFILGDMINEGKTKMVYDIKSEIPGRCLIVSKDVITAHNMAKKNVMEGKAEYSTNTNAAIMEILSDYGLKTAYIKQVNKTSYLAVKCHMIPIEWVCRRVATGSFIRRHQGVKEGYRFSPPKLETFFKDDEKGDPQWSREVLEEAKLECGGVTITPDLIDIMEKMTVTIFEVLEQVWKTKDVSLIDMKIEFGVSDQTKEIILSDVIDNDSWRIWPSGDKRLMKDKEVYRQMKDVTTKGMQNLKENYKWVVDQLTNVKKSLSALKGMGKVAVIMGSASDMTHCKKIKELCFKLGADCELHVCSAHKCTNDTMKLLGKIEADALDMPVVIVAVAGRSNGLGPVLSGNTILPVINCPPMSETWGSSDVWSSLRLPSGLGCVTAMTPDVAALSAAQMLAHNNVNIWGKLRINQLRNWMNVKKSNIKLMQEEE